MSIELNQYHSDNDAYPHILGQSKRYVFGDIVEILEQYEGLLPPEIADEAEAYLKSLDETRSN